MHGREPEHYRGRPHLPVRDGLRPAVESQPVARPRLPRRGTLPRLKPPAAEGRWSATAIRAAVLGPPAPGLRLADVLDPHRLQAVGADRVDLRPGERPRRSLARV